MMPDKSLSSPVSIGSEDDYVWWNKKMQRPVAMYFLNVQLTWQITTKNFSLEVTPIITFLVVGRTHHWISGHTFCLLKAAPAFHWPTRVDCNLGPHLPAQLAKCPLQHSHAECSDCCHEGISGDKTNGSKPHSTTTRDVVVFSRVETGIRMVI